jgi:uncharacterized protein YjbI with pentapeptide repeats
MADEEHVALLKQGVKIWNKWREENPDISPDLNGADLLADLFDVTLDHVNLSSANLSGADLSGAKLSGAHLGEAHLSGAHLSGAHLSGADLRAADLYMAHLHQAHLGEADLYMARLGEADLRGADLSGARLGGTDLRGARLGGADLRRADLSEADLGRADLSEADLGRADLSRAHLRKTVFADTNLSQVKGLDSCIHSGPSTFEHRTLQRSGSLPLAFLRGVGLPDNLIDYLPSLLNQPIQFFSCFISYSSKDHEFADRLHADLQSKGVRCWFAPHDMQIGAEIIDAIDEAIRLRDKVLLILSEHSVASRWVEGEVTRSLDEERERKQVVLFPVRIDGTVMETTKPWARLLRGQRNIGDFTCWKDHDAYQKILDRLLRDLKVAQAEP